MNRLDDAVLRINCALSDRKASLTFELSESNYGDHRVRVASGPSGVRDICNEPGRSVINVPADTLDNVLAGLSDRWKDDVAVIWIDVQGYEGCVFKGARQILDRGVPVVSEIWPY